MTEKLKVTRDARGGIVSIRHHPNSRRFNCPCGAKFKHWGEYKDLKDRLHPNTDLYCKCGIAHRRW